MRQEKKKKREDDKSGMETENKVYVLQRWQADGMRFGVQPFSYYEEKKQGSTSSISAM